MRWNDLDNDELIARCPFGQPGDRLWVKTIWTHDSLHCNDRRCGNVDHIWWRHREAPDHAKCFAGEAAWRSPAIMPRWAADPDLDSVVTAVRVERVQDISYQDVLCEGVRSRSGGAGGQTVDSCIGRRNAATRRAFANLWNSRYAKRGHGWDVNPWVFVTEYEKCCT
jgi:hypothetical protein